ncbi:asparagine synthase (glutamine-hydrolyzing) [Pontibacter sp. H249]|uniref:asparagine synthase (glutamine-hydrolyzing) n=1 Tax=Pontibacter sp. H249 TaxID=3133420 RepID=UPI0030BDB59C
MCGIIGHFQLSNLPGIVPSLSKIRHRGPDGESEWTNSSGNVYLGHTRLAILEPTEAGQQPMQDASGRFIITFNGEIYNHLTLRRLLPQVNWRGTSDTETLIELYAAKGMESLALIKGMFAFAIHDSAEDSLLLVRDRLGIKPLWFRHDSGGFSFSSEARPLLQIDESIPTTNALSEYIGFGRFPGHGEIFKDVHLMPAGSWMKLTSDGKVEKENWWNCTNTIRKQPASRKSCVQQVKKLVTTAIEEHIISDVGVGAFLSGGIDSSIVTLVAGKVLGHNLKTFTVGFKQASHDERSIARKVANLAGTEHCELEVSEDTCLSWVMEAVGKLDAPSVDAINTYIVSKAVREAGLKVALSGLGGDELFCGYPSFKDVPKLRWLNAFPDHVKERLIQLMPPAIRGKLAGLQHFTVPDLAINRRRFTSAEMLSNMSLKHGSPFIPAAPDGLDTLGLISWAEIQSYMIPMLLRDSDQMSMAVGLEIRVPFLDHCLVEEVLHYPQQYKRGKGVKPLLVEAFKDDLPTEVYDRPKQGFALPMDFWIRGPLADFTDDGIEAAIDILKLDEPYKQYCAFLDGSCHWTRVWQWCVLGHWLSRSVTCERAGVILP